VNAGSKGDGEGGEGGKGDGEKTRFSDWMEDARPLAKGKDRVPLRANAPTRKPASRSSKNDRATRGGARGFRFPADDQPNRAAREGVSDRQLRDLASGVPPPEERIDLHGTRADAAPPILEKRFASARARGLRTTLIVHGYGKRAGPGGEENTPVLKSRLPEWLTTPPLAQHVLAFAPAPARLGGAGATIVLLSKTE